MTNKNFYVYYGHFATGPCKEKVFTTLKDARAFAKEQRNFGLKVSKVYTCIEDVIKAEKDWTFRLR